MKRSLLLLLPCLFLILASCGGSPQGVNSFSMSAKEFGKGAKKFIFRSPGGYIVVEPTTKGWYYQALRPPTTEDVELGRTECQCTLYYSAQDPPFMSANSEITLDAEYQDHADGTAVLTLTGNSNSQPKNIVANVALALLGITEVESVANQDMQVYITLTFTGEAAGSWSSIGSYSGERGGISGTAFRIISR